MHSKDPLPVGESWSHHVRSNDESRVGGKRNRSPPPSLSKDVRPIAAQRLEIRGEGALVAGYRQGPKPLPELDAIDSRTLCQRPQTDS